VLQAAALRDDEACLWQHGVQARLLLLLLLLLLQRKM
jgi:hypothetical protein